MAKYRLKDVIIRANTKVDKDTTNLVYYVGGEHFTTGDVIVDHRGLIEGSTIGPMFYYGFKAGQFLLVSRNPHLKKAGVVDFDGICSEKTFVLETADPSVLSPRFLPFVLQNDRFWEYAVANRHGSTNFFINWATLSSYEFDLPTIEEQEKLADILWALVATKKKYEKLLRKTDELVKSQFIERFGDAVNGKEKYPLLSLKDVCSIIQDGEHATVKRVDKGNLFISARNIKTDHQIVLDTVTYINDENFAKIRKRFAPKKDDILLTCAGTIGNSAIVPELPPFVADRGLTMLRPDDSKVLSEYLHASIVSDYVQEQMRQGTHATALAHLYLNKINAIKIIVPTIEKQKEFVEFLQQSDKSKFELTQAISRIDDMIKALMQS